MDNRIKNLFLLAVLTLSTAKAQKPVSSDCSNPVKLTIGTTKQYGPTDTPIDSGRISDIGIGKNDKYFFDGEHHTSWYELTSKNECDFAFEIVPEKESDDYGFLLFKLDSSQKSSCSLISDKKMLPVRSNISRNNASLKGITGLSFNSEVEFVKEGIGSNLSKFIHVKPNEKCLLVLDNVDENGGGHSLKFFYRGDASSKILDYELVKIPVLNKVITGNVLNEDGKPLKAEVTVENTNGDELLRTVCDNKGRFTLRLDTLRATARYMINFVADSAFIEPKFIELSQSEIKAPDILVMLPKLKKGRTFRLRSMNFYGGEAVLLPESKPSVHALAKLMKKNPQLKISIEGHTNGGGHIEKSEGIYLSTQRSNTVYNYLYKKGIAEARMETKAYGDEFMLYPNDISNEPKARLNRRVEVKVLSF